MHLTRARVSLNPMRGATLDYTAHQMIANWFGDRSDRGYLFRADAFDGRNATLMVLSEHEPPLEDERPNQFGDVIELRTRPYSLNVKEGDLLDLDLRMNATRTDGQTRKRADVWMAVWEKDPDTPRSPEDVYREYLARKLDGAATIREMVLRNRRFVDASRGFMKDRQPKFVAADVAAVIEVNDPAKLHDLMRKGVGRAKAFGCGLMFVGPIGTLFPRVPRSGT